MDAARWSRIKPLLDGALDRPTHERSAFLAEACADDAALRAEIEALANAHDSAGTFLDDPLLGEAVPLPSGDDGSATLPESIGPYRVLGLLGRGGMGEVFLAERADGLFERRVALKRVRIGLDAPSITRRFDEERRILAGLEHPGIARLLDAGTDKGRPYFAMDYAEGTPLTEYAAERHLSTDARLGLFRQACDAVHHAHQRLVVHRDLKPSNVFVTEDDAGHPQVKLLDFGIAKLLDEDDERTVLTETGLRPMTRAYAAPEQLRGDDATTATDVYALGVLLYELLTRRRPFEAPTAVQLEAAILADEPTKPSTALRRTDDDTLPGDITPERLRGDLDTIVLRALAKEPVARYDSAAALADDVRRHQNRLPIAARPPSVAYRLQRFVRRNTLGVGLAAAVLVAIAAFAFYHTQRLATERDQARRAATRAEQVAVFLTEVFEAADPEAAGGDTLTARALLDRGAARIETDLAGQPEVQADLLDVMSRAYLVQGFYDRAETLARQALALRVDGPATTSLTRLADALTGQSRFAEADSLHRLVVARQRTHADTPALIDALDRRGQFLIATLSPLDSVRAVFEETLALRRQHYGSDAPGQGRLLLQYASSHHVAGDYDTAYRLFREALSEQRRHPDDPATTAETLYQLGFIESVRREYAEADTLFREAALLREQLYGRTHPKTAEALSDLATNLARAGRLEEAEPLQREALASFEQHTGRQSEGYRGALRSLRMLLSTAGRYDEAVAVSEEVIATTEVMFGTESRSYATNLSYHAQVLNNAGRPGEALTVYRRALPLVEAAFGADNPFYGVTLGGMARVAEALGRSGEAEVRYEQAYTLLQQKLGPESVERSRVALALGRLWAARGDHAGAVPLFEDAAAARVAEAREVAILVAHARHALGASLMALGRIEEAEPHLRRGVSELRTHLGPDHADARAAEADLAACLEALA